MGLIRLSKYVLNIAFAAAVSMILVACVAITPEPGVSETGPETAESQLYIDVVEVENRDGEYYVILSGNLADSCTEVTDVTTEIEGSRIKVTTIASRTADALCAQVLTPFEEAIPLAVGDLEPGEYTLSVDGVMTAFQVGDAEPAAIAGPELSESRVFVDSVEVVDQDGEYFAIVQGNFADSCTTAGDVTTELEGNVVRVTVEGVRPADAICAQMLTPFEEEIALDVQGFEPGEYVVDVNGATSTFTVSP